MVDVPGRAYDDGFNRHPNQYSQRSCPRNSDPKDWPT
jgi:hypothetical protein